MPDETMPEDITILVDFNDDQGLIEVSAASASNKFIEQSKKALDQAMDTIVGMAQKTTQLREKVPAEIKQAEIEFGIKLDFEAGAFLAKAGAEASISVKLVWERK